MGLRRRAWLNYGLTFRLCEALGSDGANRGTDRVRVGHIHEVHIRHASDRGFGRRSFNAQVIKATQSRVFPECYREKESSFGFGRDEGGSLAGNESAIVLSSIFSRFACGSPGSTGRSSGSLRWTLTMFEVRVSREAFLRLMINGNPVCSGFFRRWRSRAPSHPKSSDSPPSYDPSIAAWSFGKARRRTSAPSHNHHRLRQDVAAWLPRCFRSRSGPHFR